MYTGELTHTRRMLLLQSWCQSPPSCQLRRHLTASLYVIVHAVKLKLLVPPQVHAESDPGRPKLSGSDADVDTVPPHVVARCADHRTRIDTFKRCCPVALLWMSMA
jgi:hypothetical protein